LSEFPITPTLITGGKSIDDRGSVSFFNEIDLSIWKRFYIVSNHSLGFIRAWHGHKLEHKMVIPLEGSSLVASVKIDDWVRPSIHEIPEKFTLSADSPKALFIPKGFANGFKTLTPDAKLLFLSSSTLEESSADDYRFDWNLWNPWEVEFR
jgi:dTDP-4-dehydrorhamnose 3,5-epimerase-like enzyme